MATVATSSSLAGNTVASTPIKEQEGWQLLRTHLDLADRFALIVLTAPDENTLNQVRLELVASVGPDQPRREIVFQPMAPARTLTEQILDKKHAAPPLHYLWVSAPASIHDPAAVDLRAWREAFTYLNQHRNRLRKEIPGTLILAGTPETLTTLREYAPDLWSVRSALIPFAAAPADRPASLTPSSFKFTVAKVARYLMPFVKPLTLGMIDLKDGTTKELVDAGLDFFGEETGEKIKDYLKAEPDAATGLIDQHLVRHTGQVLGTLVKRYAKEQAVAEHKADLLKLAKVTPEAWAEFLQSDGLQMEPLRDDEFQQRLATALNPKAAAATLDPAAFVEFFRWLAVQKNLLGPLKPGVTPALTNWITQHLDAQLLIDLCKDTPEANAAWKESTLRILFDAHGKLDLLNAKTDLLHQKIDVTAPVIAETNQTVKVVQQQGDLILGQLADALKGNSADSRLAAYKRSLLSAFSAYQELALDNYAAGDQTCPDIWDIFVHPACATDHLRPEDMDAAQRETPPRLPAQDLLPILGSDTDRRHVLLADPGMGKSTLIQSLIAHLANGRSLAGAPALSGLLPVPLILRDLVPLLPQDQPESWTWDSLITVLLEQYQREETAPLLLEAYRGHTAEFRQLIHSSDKVFFLIDGLDEIGDLVKRQKIVGCIQDGVRAVSKKARWLITSRVIGYEEAAVDIVTRRWPMDPIDKTRHRSQGQVPWATAELGMREFDCEWQDWLISGTGWDENDSTSLEMRAKEWTAQDENWRRLTGIETSYIRRLFIAHRLYLAPFDDKRQDSFTSKWFQKRHSTDHSKELMREVRAHHHDGVRIISRVPNLLCMMNMLKRSGKPLPDGRAALYDEIVKAYLGGIDAAYKLKPIIGNSCPFEASERRHLLSLLGAHMQQSRTVRSGEPRAEGEESQTEPKQESEGNILISVPELETLLLPAIQAMQQAGKVKGDHSAAALLDELLRHIASRSGLLIPRSSDAEGNTVYGFTHLSFLEFFAAEWLGKEFDRQRNRIVRRAEAAAEDQALSETDLDRDFPPPGPVQHKRADFDTLAASPAWHEPLIFLVESRKSDTATLLRWLFPSLHAPNREQRTENSESAKPLLPLDAVRLAVQLAHDQELALSPETRRHWWRTLWFAYLTWPHPPWEFIEGKGWPIAPLLLGRAEDHTEILQALVEVYAKEWGLPSPTPMPPLNLVQCSQLTSADLAHITGLGQLETLDLTGCTGLESLPDLSALQGLKQLDLSYCTGLHSPEALSGLTGLGQLEQLDLNRCTGLDGLPDLSAMQRLKWLDLRGCTGLHGPQALSGLSGLGQLVTLSLNGCNGLESLPDLSAMQGLKQLDLRYCTGLHGPQALSGLSGLGQLETLEISYCTGLESLPDLSAMQGIKQLDLRYCTGLHGPQALSGLTGLGQLEQLDLIRCTGLESLPDLSAMQGLKRLDLSFCTGLHGSEALSSLTGLGQLETLYLNGCTGLESLPDMSAMQGLKEIYLIDSTGLRGPQVLSGLTGLGQLERLDLEGCTGLESLPDLSAMQSLRHLDLRGCTGLKDRAGLQERVPPGCKIYGP